MKKRESRANLKQASSRDRTREAAGRPDATKHRSDALRRPQFWKRLISSLVLFVLLALGIMAVDRFRLPDPAAATYVGGQTCAVCHAEATEKWNDSHHSWAMRDATQDTVRGDFDDAEFTHQGVTSRLFRERDQFFVNTDGPTGELETFPIKYTFGVEPLQQYLVEFPGGRLQALSIAWDTENRCWFHLYPDEKIPHDDVLHWTKPAQNWNYMCAECHSTNLQRNYDLTTGTYETTWSDLNVSCEACHGPGSAHVQVANSWRPSRRLHYRHGLAPIKNSFRNWQTGPPLRAGESATASRASNNRTTQAQLDEARAEIDTCAKCHARRGIVYPGHRAGSKFLDHYVPELLDRELYYEDGQIRDEVYEYTSFLQSRMFREAVRCSDCHDPHSARLRAEGNSLCTRCHVAGKYDAAAHHHHQAGSKGAACVECHMPTRTYMVVDPRRDHSIRIPRPDLSAALGTPNACNSCHNDQTPEWASDRIIEWFGPTRRDDPPYALALAAGRAGKREGERPLLALTKRSNVGPVVRASAVAILNKYSSSSSREIVVAALSDREPIVRSAAARALEGQLDSDSTRALARALTDPVRLVRVEATRVLSQVPGEQLSVEDRAAFAGAFAEYEAGQLAVSDQATAHHNLALVYSNLGQLQRAESEYRTALQLNPEFLPARFNLAMLHNRRGDNSAAERTLREVIKLDPKMADAHYSLGLLLAEDGSRLAEAATCLGTAARLAPNRARVQYNFGLAMQRLNRPKEAESALLAACSLEPTASDFLYALAVFYSQQKKWPRRGAGSKNFCVSIRPTSAARRFGDRL